MGKKRIIKKTEEEILQEKEKLDRKLKKEISLRAPQKLKRGMIFISSSYNNTIITLTDLEGNALAWQSAGSLGFKGTKKGTSYAASRVAQAISEICFKLNIKEVAVLIKGIGGGRDTALKTLVNRGLEIESIRDVTPIPHNGCRPPKPRRT